LIFGVESIQLRLKYCCNPNFPIDFRSLGFAGVGLEGVGFEDLGSLGGLGGTLPPLPAALGSLVLSSFGTPGTYTPFIRVPWLIIEHLSFSN
jgi:hypothetical protein